MNSLKVKWEDLATPLKAVVAGVGAIIAIVFVVKVLPALVAAMGLAALIAVLFIPYWIPTIVAFVRKHPSKAGILAVNFFFGWTFIGWVLSLAWALSDNTARGAATTVVVNTTVSPTFSVGNTEMAPASQYRVGDGLNGRQYNGAAWVADHETPTGAPLNPSAGMEPGR